MTAGSYGESVFTFVRNCQTVPKSGGTDNNVVIIREKKGEGGKRGYGGTNGDGRRLDLGW